MPVQRAPGSVVVVFAALLGAGRAGAPPPLSPFPDLLLPADGSTAPENTRLWVLGENAPRPGAVGVAVSVDDAAVAVVLEPLGRQGFVVDLGGLAEGSVVDVLVSSAAGEVQGSFVVGGGDDDTAPAVDVAVVIDDKGGALVIGLEGSDDRGLAGFVARQDDVVVGATAPDRLLVVAGPCVDVSAVDLAGNESDVVTLCAGEGEGEGDGGEGDGDEGEGDGGEGEGDGGGGCGCSGARSAVAPAALLLGLLGLLARRKR